jgi:hypothetical protein
LIKTLKPVHRLQPPFFFVIGVEPDLSIRIRRMKSFEKRGGTWGEEILGRDIVCSGSIVGCRWTKEGTDGGVARD